MSESAFIFLAAIYTVSGKKRLQFSLHNFNKCRHSFVIFGKNHPEDSNLFLIFTSLF